ncbi:nucleoid-associated protein [Burkholderia gladioli]|uniref:nucleoid-associated protein n=1 Tax=Burkholderia gladioli TaxID=28095 RepID=UPI001641E206|nr:nucleoid-associated protein [Burkholderia gladioli]
MPIQIRHSVIHGFEKEAGAQVARVVKKDRLLDNALESVNALVQGMVTLLGKKESSQIWGKFSDNGRQGLFPGRFEGYAGDLDSVAGFLDLSHLAVDEIARAAEGQHASTGGHILCSTYDDDRGNTRVIVAMIKQRSGLQLDADLVPINIIEVDMSKLHQAAQIRVGEFLAARQQNQPAVDAEDADVSYLSFVAMRSDRGSSAYFVDALGCEVAVGELEKDYDYANDQLESDVLICPLCATRHDNTLLERASLLQDRADAEHQVEELTERQSRTEATISATLSRLDTVREDLAKLNRRFKRLDKDVTLKSILESMGTDSVRRRATAETNEARKRQRDYNKRLYTLRQELSALIDDDHVDTINRYYRSELRTLCEVLRIKPDFDIETVTPLEFRKLKAAGGGADNLRMRLVYYLALHRVIQHFKTETLAPLVLDTPNQQDQGALNYVGVAAELKRRAVRQTQFIVCATRHEAMSQLEVDSHVIELNEGRLLSESVFERYEERFIGWFA